MTEEQVVDPQIGAGRREALVRDSQPFLAVGEVPGGTPSTSVGYAASLLQVPRGRVPMAFRGAVCVRE